MLVSFKSTATWQPTPKLSVLKQVYYFSWSCGIAVHSSFSDFIHGFIQRQIWWGWRSKVTSFTHLVVLLSSPCGLSHFPNVEISEQHSRRVKMKLQDFWGFSLWSCTAFIPLYSVCQAKSKNQYWFKGWGNRSHLLIMSLCKGSKRWEKFVAIFSISYNIVWFHLCEVEQQTNQCMQLQIP